ncbi:CGNR zinc finger domain-containing protein [Streptomyces sp. NPDC057137]|uniref:CGNR zinc finger domain-containing protein n=1 Tax=Streptomyces sp. NPDC057137 TaxID=3346030 RepID=UPI0036408079
MESIQPGTPESPPQTAAPLLGEPLPVELMNTIWVGRDGVHDELTHPEGLAAWLRGVQPRLSTAGGPSLAQLPNPSAEDLRRFRRLRDALRLLAAVTTGDTRDTRGAGLAPDTVPGVASDAAPLTTAVAAVNEACAYAPSWSALEWTGAVGPTRTDVTNGTPYARILSRVAEEGVRLFTGPGRAELRACHGPRCVLYFVRSHPRREWCSADCGNRARVARHYRRHRDAGEAAKA